jgi:effector-binding domain-containing protein
MDGDGILVHATIPVDAREDHDFAIVDLPEIEQAATILYRAAMDDVMPTIQALTRWIDANGYRSVGYNRELYIELGENRDNRAVTPPVPAPTTSSDMSSPIREVGD